MIDGSELVAQTMRGAKRVMQLLTSWLFSCFAKITKEVRAIINLSEYSMTLPLSSAGILSAQHSHDTCTEDAAAVYADDSVHGFYILTPSLSPAP